MAEDRQATAQPILSVGVVFQDASSIPKKMEEFKGIAATQLDVVLCYVGKETLPDASFELAKRAGANLVQVSTGSSLGDGMNRIAATIATPWFLVLDDDVVPEPRQIAKLEELIEALPDGHSVAAIQALVLNSSSSPWSHYELLTDQLSYLAVAPPGTPWYKKRSIDVVNRRELEVLQGGARAFRTAAFLEVDGAPSARGGVDRALGMRFRSAGKSILFDPAFTVRHPFPSSLSEVMRRKWKQSRASLRNRRIRREREPFWTWIGAMYWSGISPPSLFADSIRGRVYYAAAIYALATGAIVNGAIHRLIDPRL